MKQLTPGWFLFARLIFMLDQRASVPSCNTCLSV